MISIVTAALLAATAPLPAVCGAIRPSPEAQSPATVATVDGVKAFLAAAKTLDDAAFVAAIKDRGPLMPDDPEPASWLRLRGLIRNLEFCGVKAIKDGKVEIWLFDTSFERFLVGVFAGGATPTDKISFLDIVPSDNPPGYVRPQLTIPALIDAVEKRAADMAAKDQFSGAVLIARHGKILFQQAYGFADREARKPNMIDSQFRFGSMGKMFTIVAIMQLAQDGKIDLQAPIGRYLTTYPNQEIATKVTVAHLLTHTGGTGDIFGPDYVTHRATLRDLKDYVNLYSKRAPGFAPGSQFAYSNYGFILLGRIVEEVSHGSYDAYLQQHIFAPAGMTSTGNLPEATTLPRRAVAYTGSGTQLRRADDTLPVRGTAAGGGYSTVGDFEKFAEGLTSHRLLRAETLKTLIEGGIKAPDGKFYKYDFGETMPGMGRFIGHGGGAPGMNGDLIHFLDSGYTVVVLANRDPNAAGAVARFAANRLPAK